MAIQGSITIPVYNSEVTLENVYMRVTGCTTRNEYRLIDVPQPDGEDGLPNEDKLEFVKFVEIVGFLEIYEKESDVSEGMPAIARQDYTIPYDNTEGAAIAEVQLYEHIKTLSSVQAVDA